MVPEGSAISRGARKRHAVGGKSLPSPRFIIGDWRMLVILLVTFCIACLVVPMQPLQLIFMSVAAVIYCVSSARSNVGMWSCWDLRSYDVLHLLGFDRQRAKVQERTWWPRFCPAELIDRFLQGRILTNRIVMTVLALTLIGYACIMAWEIDDALAFLYYATIFLATLHYSNTRQHVPSRRSNAIFSEIHHLTLNCIRSIKYHLCRDCREWFRNILDKWMYIACDFAIGLVALALTVLWIAYETVVFLLLGVATFFFMQALSKTLPNYRSSKLRETSSSPLARHSLTICKKSLPSSLELAGISSKSCEYLDAQIAELLREMEPTEQTKRIVEGIAHSVEDAVRKIFPLANVTGFVHGQIRAGQAFTVAVPEVELVINVDFATLVSHVYKKQPQGRGHSVDVGLRLDKLQKSAIRSCAECLVVEGAFKFRRSAFRGIEPKVTLLAPCPPGLLGASSVPVDLYINGSIPFNYAALLAECDRVDRQARELISLIRRWAKERGICRSGVGFLCPYAWAVLVVNFLQVGFPAILLPPIHGAVLHGVVGASVRALPSGGGRNQGFDSSDAKQTVNENCFNWIGVSVGSLFKAFIDFYSRDFDWHGNQVIDVRLGQRRQRFAAEASAFAVLDPYQPRRNLAAQLREDGNDEGQRLLFDELHRASELLSSGASLAELLRTRRPDEAGSDSPQSHACLPLRSRGQHQHSRADFPLT